MVDCQISKNCYDDQFVILKKNLQSTYQNKYSTITPLPWKKGFSLSLDDVFIERHGHLMIKEKLSWKLHDQWIDVDAVTLMALAFHYCQSSSQSIIAVEGKMGSGKSTLCKRILRDWAGESFDIMEGICLLYLNVNEGKDLSCINEQNICKLFDLPTNIDHKLVWKIFQEKQEEILVFIDINKTQTSLDWLQTLCYKLLPRAKYIIFCRPDMLYKILDISSVRICLQDFDSEKIHRMLENLSIDYYIQDEIVDVMNEDESITRLCTNPFLCTAFMITCKEQFGVKFTDNSVRFIRTFIGFIWKRFVSESRVTLEDLDILMTSLSGVFIDIFENGGYLCETDVHNLEHGRLLLESGLLHQETINADANTNILCYSFFDIIINEYACALHFSQTLSRRPEERGFIGAILKNPKWHTICRLTASILKTKAHFLINELLSDRLRLEVDQLKLLCECVHECGAFDVPNDQLNEKRKLFEESLDFGNAEVTSSTIKGLKTILTQLHNLKDNSYPLRNRHRSTRNITRLYKSCNDIFSVMDDEIIRCEMCIRYESSFICKRCQLANMQKKRKNTERNNMISDIEEKLRRNNTTKFGSVKNNLNKYSRSLLDLSLSSGLISRETSMMSLDDINTVNGRKRDVATLKELSIKGSCINNKNMVELMGLVNSCHLERLYMMGDAENPGQPISNKLVDSFIMSICQNMTHISLNDYHLGEYWMKRLCKIVKEKSDLISIRISVSCIHELSVESAFALVKAVKMNHIIENVELYCGVQPMVIMTLFNFYEELLAKDERLHLVFL